MKQIAIESFQWAQQLYPILKQYESEPGVSIYKVIAATSDIRNDNHRIYTKKQHEYAAASLSERSLNINHDPSKTLPFPDNEVVAARYEDGHVECLIQVADPQVNRMIETGEINHVSVEGLYLDESNNTDDTEYPTSLHYRALALLTKDDQPGDPNTRIFKDHTGRRLLFTESLRTAFQKVIFDSNKVNMLQKKPRDSLWPDSMINDFPDSSFAAIEPGGKRDEEGKTVPRSLRHLPYKDASGKPDATHVRNALARLSQTQISAQLKGAARQKLVAAAKELGIDTSMDEAFKNFKISREILRACLEQGDADDDSLLKAQMGMSLNPQMAYVAGGSMPETGASPGTVPSGEMPTQPVPSGDAPGGDPNQPNAPNVVPQQKSPILDLGNVSQTDYSPNQVPSGEMPAATVPKGVKPKGNDATGPNNPSGDGGPQTNFTIDQAVKPNTQTVPGASASQSEAETGGPRRHMLNMNPHQTNPELIMSPLSHTNEPDMDPTTQKEIEHGVDESFRFRGRKVKLALVK